MVSAARSVCVARASRVAAAQNTRPREESIGIQHYIIIITAPRDPFPGGNTHTHAYIITYIMRVCARVFRFIWICVYVWCDIFYIIWSCAIAITLLLLSTPPFTRRYSITIRLVLSSITAEIFMFPLDRLNFSKTFDVFTKLLFCYFFFFFDRFCISRYILYITI